MSDLRDTIAETIFDCALVNGGASEDVADAILDAVYDALTSDAVALQVGLHVASDTLAIVENREPFIMGSIPYTENGKRYIAAALRAAEIVKGERDD